MSVWTEELTEKLKERVKDETKPVPYDVCEKIGEEFNVSARSVTGKLRNLGIEYEKKGAQEKAKSYSEEDEKLIARMAEKGKYIEEIAEKLGREVKSIRGKLLSMKITGVKTRDKAQPKAKTYTEAEENKIEKLAGEGKYIEDIAEALGRTVPQIRGKLLSMKITGVQTKNKKAAPKKLYTEDLVAKLKAEIDKGKGLEDIAKQFDLNPRGMKAQLAKLGIIDKAEKKKFWTDDKIQEVLDLFESTDLTVDKIADKVGSSYPQVAKVLKNNDIDYESRKPAKKTEE